MSSAHTKPARGMRDFLPEDVRRREYVIGVIADVYGRYAFDPLETPAVENIETLTGKYGEEGNQLIFRILKRGEKLISENPRSAIRDPNSLADLALRYDLTVPLARVVANQTNELPKFFKRYQIQPVWRADRPARGGFREVYQCAVDAIGSGSVLVETELISAVSEIFKRLGFAADEFRILLNHRKILIGLLDCSGIPVEKHADALVAIDKIDKIGEAGVASELLQRSIPPAGAEKFRKFIFRITNESSKFSDESPYKANDFVIGEVAKFISGHSEAEGGLCEIKEILRLSESNDSKNQILVAPPLARGLSYYTGAIMESF